MELLVWLCAGVGIGLFVAMVVFAIFSAVERRHLRRWRRDGVLAPVVDRGSVGRSENPATTLALMEPEESERRPAPADAVSPSKAIPPTAGAAVSERPATPRPAAERSQLDVEGLFEEAFQSSLKPEAPAAEPPEQKRP
ncbi:MAG TPA: hypothetical protein VGN80_19925 [Devosiaceae bacterium]|nr:hypothetical protein [Devosiaceae bacterium]